MTDESIVQHSSKLKVLDAMMSKWIPAGHRVLIFVQFVEVRMIIHSFIHLFIQSINHSFNHSFIDIAFIGGLL